MKDKLELCLKLVGETQDEFLVTDDGGVSHHWPPKSVVETDDYKVFTVPEWLASDRGFI